MSLAFADILPRSKAVAKSAPEPRLITSLDDFNPNSPMFVIPFFPIWALLFVAEKLADAYLAWRYPFVVEITQETFGRTSVSFNRTDVREWLAQNNVRFYVDEWLVARFRTEADAVHFTMKWL